MGENIYKQAARGVVPVSQETGSFQVLRAEITADDEAIPSVMSAGAEVTGYSGAVLVAEVDGGGSAVVTPYAGYAGVGFCALPVACPAVTVASGTRVALFVDCPGAAAVWASVTALTTPEETTCTVQAMPVNW